MILLYDRPTIRPKTMYPEKPMTRRLRRPVYRTTNAPAMTPGMDRTDRRSVHSSVLTTPAPGITPAMIVLLKIPFGNVTKSYLTV